MMTSFADRLTIERKRLGKTQAEFGELGGVHKNAQLEYEKGNIEPSSGYLLKLVDIGVDMNYLFHGEYSLPAESGPLRELLHVLNQLTPPQQALGFAMLNMIQNTGKHEDELKQGDVMWRASRVFTHFIQMGRRGRLLVECAVDGVKDDRDEEVDKKL
jgi:transcriptional regulator with XRE-family HTH domain